VINKARFGGVGVRRETLRRRHYSTEEGARMALHGRQSVSLPQLRFQQLALKFYVKTMEKKVKQSALVLSTVRKAYLRDVVTVSATRHRVKVIATLPANPN
jgi:hypothetical protein